jgi:8-oxo-dGTP pyrophosphatase MutT (NUDIX family)
MSGASSLRRHFTASAFVLTPERRILLIEHRKLGVWLYPGGHIESQETPDAAVVREVREETGVAIEILCPPDRALDDASAGVTALHTPYRILCEYIPEANDPHYHIDLIYLCTPLDEQTVPSAERAGAAYFTSQESEQLKLFPNFRVMLRGVYRDPQVWDLIAARSAPER